MSVYVDPLMRHGWVIRGKATPSMRTAAVAAGAVELDARGAVASWRQIWGES